MLLSLDVGALALIGGAFRSPIPARGAKYLVLMALVAFLMSSVVLFAALLDQMAADSTAEKVAAARSSRNLRGGFALLLVGVGMLAFVAVEVIWGWK